MNSFERRVIRGTYRNDRKMVAIVGYSRTATQPRFVAEPISTLHSLAIVVLQQAAKSGLAADVGNSDGIIRLVFSPTLHGQDKFVLRTLMRPVGVIQHHVRLSRIPT
jgi:hypothetical protein